MGSDAAFVGVLMMRIAAPGRFTRCRAGLLERPPIL